MLSSKTSAKELNIHGLLILQSCKPKKAGESVSWRYQSAFQPCDHQPNWGPVTLWGRVAYYVPVNQSWFCIFFYWLFIRQQLGSFQVLRLRTFPHSALWNAGSVACMKRWNADWETWNASEDFREMCSNGRSGLFQHNVYVLRISRGDQQWILQVALHSCELLATRWKPFRDSAAAIPRELRQDAQTQVI